MSKRFDSIVRILGHLMAIYRSCLHGKLQSSSEFQGALLKGRSVTEKPCADPVTFLNGDGLGSYSMKMKTEQMRDAL